MSLTITALVIVAALYLASVSTFHILSSEHLERTQRNLQLLLTWVVPILAPIIFIAAHLSDKDNVAQVLETNSKFGLLGKIFSFLTLASFGGVKEGDCYGGIDLGSIGDGDSGGGDGGD